MLQLQVARRGVQGAVGRGPYAGSYAGSLLFFFAFTYSNLALQGLGVLMMSDGSRYIGEFFSDKFCGRGRLESSNGDFHIDSCISISSNINNKRAWKYNDNISSNNCVPTGHVREGSWIDDLCTQEQAIDSEVTHSARAIADEALALSDTGQSGCSVSHLFVLTLK